MNNRDLKKSRWQSAAGSKGWAAWKIFARPVSVKYGRYVSETTLYPCIGLRCWTRMERGWSQLRTFNRRKQNQNESECPDQKIERSNIRWRITQSTRISRVKFYERRSGLNEQCLKTFFDRILVRRIFEYLQSFLLYFSCLRNIGYWIFVYPFNRGMKFNDVSFVVKSCFSSMSRSFQFNKNFVNHPRINRGGLYSSSCISIISWFTISFWDLNLNSVSLYSYCLSIL